MLLRWGEDPVFILAFGGVHPRYEQRLPAGFPKLDRLSVALTRGNNPRLLLQAYVAVTSNSFQIGGKLEVFASIGKFSIDGMIAIDALFQSGEPSVIFDLAARLQIKAWGVNLFTAKFQGTFQGWHPSSIKGKATFEIWIFDYTIPIDHTFGKASPPPPLPPTDVRTPLLAALGDPRNWQAITPDTRQSLVTLRGGQTPGPSDILLHPLGRLAVNQRVVPLGITVDRVGEARPAGGARFSIDSASVHGGSVPISPTRDQFARAQYFDMTDDEKLSSPPFESMTAGVEIGGAALGHGPGVTATTKYETLIYGSNGDPIDAGRHVHHDRGPPDHAGADRPPAVERGEVQRPEAASQDRLVALRRGLHRRHDRESRARRASGRRPNVFRGGRGVARAHRGASRAAGQAATGGEEWLSSPAAPTRCCPGSDRD